MYRRIIIGLLVIMMILTCTVLSNSKDLTVERKEYLTQLNNKVENLYPENFKVKVIMLQEGMNGYLEILQVYSELMEDSDDADALMEYFIKTEEKNLNRYGILMVFFEFLDGKSVIHIKSRQV